MPLAKDLRAFDIQAASTKRKKERIRREEKRVVYIRKAVVKRKRNKESEDS